MFIERWQSALSKKWDLTAFLEYRHIQVTFVAMEINTAINFTNSNILIKLINC